MDKEEQIFGKYKIKGLAMNFKLLYSYCLCINLNKNAKY